jgi:translin
LTSDAIGDSLKEIETDLQQVLSRRERILKDSRDVILASSRAIVSLHAGKLPEARAEIDEARMMLQSLRKDGQGSLARYLVSPETEFVEANAVYSIVRAEPLPDRHSLEVSNEAYLLGLLDTVGELKRLLLDSITKGEAKKTKEYFRLMEELYSSLSSFAVFDNIVNGVRRKIDVARMITEDARGILAEESTRRSLLSSIEKLQRSMKGQRNATS